MKKRKANDLDKLVLHILPASCSKVSSCLMPESLLSVPCVLRHAYFPSVFTNDDEVLRPCMGEDRAKILVDSNT
jgi:hypothetical protein